MKGLNFTTLIRKITRTNSTTFTDDDIILYANIAKDDISERIQEAVDSGYFEIEEVRDLIADQREYSLPEDLLLNIKKAYIKVDGEWMEMDEFDLSQYSGTTDEEGIQDYFGKRSPSFDITGRGLKIYSQDAIVATTEGLKIISSTYPADLTVSDLTATTDLSVPVDPLGTIKHAMPRAVHKVWSRMVTKSYKEGKDKPMKLDKFELELDDIGTRKGKISDALQKLKVRNKDLNFIPTTPYDDGSQY